MVVDSVIYSFTHLWQVVPYGACVEWETGKNNEQDNFYEENKIGWYHRKAGPRELTRWENGDWVALKGLT